MTRLKMHTQQLGEFDIFPQVATATGYRLSKTYKGWRKAVRAGNKSFVLADKKTGLKHRIYMLPRGRFRVSVIYSNSCIGCRVAFVWDGAKMDFDTDKHISWVLLKLQEYLRQDCCKPHALVVKRPNHNKYVFGVFTASALVLGAQRGEVIQFLDEFCEDIFIRVFEGVA